MHPDAIHDPEAREAYKQLIASNRQKSENYAIQSQLASAQKDLTAYTAEFCRRNFDTSSEEQAEILRALETHIADASLQMDLRAQLVKEQTKPAPPPPA
jgi:hypothetical protein